MFYVVLEGFLTLLILVAVLDLSCIFSDGNIWSSLWNIVDKWGLEMKEKCDQERVYSNGGAVSTTLTAADVDYLCCC
jgi:hypothetical protein